MQTASRINFLSGNELTVGSSREEVWRWESGEVAPIVDQLWKICDVLQYAPAELFSTADEGDLDLEDESVIFCL